MTISIADRLSNDDYRLLPQTVGEKVLGQRFLVRDVGIYSDDTGAKFQKDFCFNPMVGADVEDQVISPKTNQSLSKEGKLLFALFDYPWIGDSPVGIIKAGAL